MLLIWNVSHNLTASSEL